MRSRFIREGKAAALLSHPNIVPVYETGADRGSQFIVSHAVRGWDLSSYMATQLSTTARPMRADEAALIAWRLADATQHAHSKSVLHRDLKPTNVLLEGIDSLSSDPQSLAASIRITDFGLARITDSEEALQLTTTGAIVGTPAYMSPEQAIGDHQLVDARSDIFSLGVMLYELLTGVRPFQGVSLLDTVRQVKEADPPRPRILQKSIPRDLEAICLKCLEKDPAKRYATAHDLTKDLAAFLDRRPVKARHHGPLLRALAGSVDAHW